MDVSAWRNEWRYSGDSMKKEKAIYQCCFKCGRKLGTYVAGCSSVWKGKCDVCGKENNVTEIRDFNYLVKKKNIRFCKKCGEYTYIPEGKKRYICSNPFCPEQQEPK